MPRPPRPTGRWPATTSPTAPPVSACPGDRRRLRLLRRPRGCRRRHRARPRRRGPSLIEVKLTRYYGHFEGDAQTYRDPDEVKHYRETRDCLKQFRERTCHAGLLSASDLDAIDAEVEARIEDAVQRAKNDPKPEPDDLLRDVYVSYP